MKRIMRLATGEKRVALDPRTVSRSQILDRLGDTRPSLSVIILAADVRKSAVAAFAARARHRGVQVIAVAQAEANDAARSVGTDDAPAIEPIRRAGHQCIGRLIVLLPPDELFLPDKAALRRFAVDASLAAIMVEGPEAGSAIVIRETVWSALDGLDPTYGDWSWSVRDFCLRARAIGYSAPDWPAPVNDADAASFRKRAHAAADRSSQCGSSSVETRVVLYTGITNGYDTLKPQPPHLAAPEDRVAFLDQASLRAHAGRSRGWRLAPDSQMPAIDDPHRRSRYYKINAHRALAGAAYSLWVDASIGIVCPYSLGRLAELFLPDHDLCVFGHYQRQSVYEEAEACKIARLDDAAIIDAQIARYRSDKLPPEAGLIEAPILLRRHSRRMMEINEAWWAEMQVGSRRDQLSFNYVAWKNGFRYATFPLTVAMRNGLFVKFRRPTR